MTGMEELHARVKAKEEQLRRQVSVKEGHIVIDVEYEYNIPLDGCGTYEGILSWVLHLTEKTWMTTDVLERFILVACHEAGLKRPHS